MKTDFYKPVCIKMETNTQFESIKPALVSLLEEGVDFDIYIPRQKEQQAINRMYENTCSLVRSEGFTNIIRGIPVSRVYKVALVAPHYDSTINAKYYIKYSYGAILSTKPSATHRAELLNHYHAQLLCSTRDMEIFSAFCKTYLVPDLKYSGYKPAAKEHQEKKTIFMAPSWEGQNNLDWIVHAIERLSGKYRIIVKLHPFGNYGTRLNEDTVAVKSRIKNLADEYYEEDGSLVEMLGRSDLVISNISGAVFDALYVNIPAIMYEENLYRFNEGGIVSANAKYVDEHYILNSQSIDDLTRNISIAFEDGYAQKQKELSTELFSQDFSLNSAKKWTSVIQQYLNDEINPEYTAMQDILTRDFWHYKNTADRVTREVIERDESIKRLLLEIESFKGIRRSARLFAGSISRKIKSHR